jgi:hypothetical protein
MNISRSVARSVGAGALVGTLAIAMPLTSSAQIGFTQASPAMAPRTVQVQASLSAGPGHAHVMTGPTGNKIEMVAPHRSRYVPRILRASTRQRAKARRLLNGVNGFCETHTMADLKARWRPGTDNPANPTHYFNPRQGASGVHPARPRAALVYDGRVDGVMFTGKPLPYLGTIPRAHGHHAMAMGSHQGVEMVHVYCRSNLTVKSLREAFTPNRQLGVLADTKRLRLRIRPAVMDLNRRELRQVRDKVRGYVGNQSSQAARAQTARRGGPDPVLRRMRVEIRESLMELSEPQLRSVWRLMRALT